MADQESALSLVGSKVLICSFPCQDSVDNATKLELESKKYLVWDSDKLFCKHYCILKQQVTENITFRMKGSRTMALTNGIQMKMNEKGSFRTIYSRIFIPK